MTKHRRSARSPARPGLNRIAVTLFPDSPTPKEVWLELSQHAAGIGPIRRELHPNGAGRWELNNAELTIPGRWTLRLELLVSDYDQLTLQAELSVPAIP
jgi:copper transport protein